MARGQENEKGKVAVAAFSFVVLSEYVVSLFQCYLDGVGVLASSTFSRAMRRALQFLLMEAGIAVTALSLREVSVVIMYGMVLPTGIITQKMILMLINFNSEVSYFV